MFRFLFIYFYQIQCLLEMHLRRHSDFRKKSNRCFNAVTVTNKLRIVYALSFWGLELGYVPVLSQMKWLVVQDFMRINFLWILDPTCFMSTSKFLHCISQVLRRKDFIISRTMGHNSLYCICMKTAFIVIFMSLQNSENQLYFVL